MVPSSERGDGGKFVAASFVIAQALIFLCCRQHVGIIEIITVACVVSSFFATPRLDPMRHSGVLILLGLVFLVLRIMPVWTSGDLSQVYTTFADYLLLIQAIEFWRPPRTQTANYLPGLGCLAFTSVLLSFDSMLSSSSVVWTCLVFMILLFAALRPDWGRLTRPRGPTSRKKMIVIVVTVTVALACGNLFRYELRQDLPMLQRYFRNLDVSTTQTQFARSSARFVESVNLDSISQAQLADPEAPVFTAYGDYPPGYVRTMAMSRFDGWAWRNRFEQLSDRDYRPPQFPFPDWFPAADQQRVNGRLFPLRETARGARVGFELRVPVGRGRLVPLPIHATHLLVAGSRLSLDRHGSVSSGGADFRRYIAYTHAQSKSREQKRYLDDLLEIPRNESVPILKLSYEICRDASTTRERARAIEQYFQDGFTYSLDANPARLRGNRSPLQVFLNDTREGHCEYFASASVLLMRAQNIPCRMCVGYLVGEMNDEEDYYVAMNRNAHAWAEAYDESSGSWIVVESTPGARDYIERFSAGRSTEEEADEEAAIQFADQSVLDSVYDAVTAFFFSFASNRFAWIFPVAMLAVLVFYRRFHGNRTRDRVRHAGRHVLRKADRAARKLGCTRAPHETYHQFAHRLTQANFKPLADWYLEYSYWRYACDPQAPLPSPARAVATISREAKS